jgi:hypothetical protein
MIVKFELDDGREGNVREVPIANLKNKCHVGDVKWCGGNLNIFRGQFVQKIGLSGA